MGTNALTSLETALGAVIRTCRLDGLLRRIQGSRGQVPVLAYHSVAARGQGPEPSCLELARAVVSPVAFRRQMEYVARHYHTVSLADYVKSRAAGEALPESPCIITIDDGLADAWETAAPILRELGLTATFFIVAAPYALQSTPWPHSLYEVLDNAPATEIAAWCRTALPSFSVDETITKADLRLGLSRCLNAIGRDERLKRVAEMRERLSSEIARGPCRFMPPEQIRQLAEEGFEIGCHSTEHQWLAGLSDEEIDTDVKKCKETVAGIAGRDCPAFCYPFGEAGSWDDRVARILRHNGFLCACTTEQGLNSPGTDLFALRRVVVNSDTSFPAFVLRITGIQAVLRKAFRRSG